MNLSLSRDVLEAAKRLDINISHVCDNYLREVVRLELERQWRQDHADFIAAYNAIIAPKTCLWMSGEASDGAFRRLCQSGQARHHHALPVGCAE